jgi:FixJ family two-component response regulator
MYDISKTSADSIVALDDDTSIQQRLEALFPNRNIKVFAPEDEFLKSARAAESSLVLVDYDYGGTRSGIDLILAEGLTRNAVLLSGRLSFDHQIRSTAQEQGVRLFPKECLG